MLRTVEGFYVEAGGYGGDRKDGGGGGSRGACIRGVFVFIRRDPELGSWSTRARPAGYCFAWSWRRAEPASVRLLLEFEPERGGSEPIAVPGGLKSGVGSRGTEVDDDGKR
ncbi:hypothetical protein NL676_027815 [Syzygium grande]|nr:hypothetical protein NL676_027815 [Syzygium grande]